MSSWFRQKCFLILNGSSWSVHLFAIQLNLSIEPVKLNVKHRLTWFGAFDCILRIPDRNSLTKTFHLFDIGIKTVDSTALIPRSMLVHLIGLTAELKFHLMRFKSRYRVGGQICFLCYYLSHFWTASGCCAKFSLAVTMALWWSDRWVSSCCSS